MTDATIRDAYHRKCLKRHHAHHDTLVVDELGLQHGRSRADIAIINGSMTGVEIKSDVDSLERLDYQVIKYSSVFDHAYVVATKCHLVEVSQRIPEWWGLIFAEEGPRGGVHFSTIRGSMLNKMVDDFAVAQLLWRNEVMQILSDLGTPKKHLRQSREKLYGLLLETLPSQEIRAKVREKLRKRANWRNRA